MDFFYPVFLYFFSKKKIQKKKTACQLYLTFLWWLSDLLEKITQPPETNIAPENGWLEY